MEGKNDFMIKRKWGRRKKILRDASGRLNQEEKNKTALNKEPGTNYKSRKQNVKDRKWSWVWRWVSVVTALGKWRQQDQKVKGITSFIFSSRPAWAKWDCFITTKTTGIVLKELRALLTRFLMARANMFLRARRIDPAKDSSVSSQEDFEITVTQENTMNQRTGK